MFSGIGFAMPFEPHPNTGGTNLRKVPLTETVQKRCNDQGDQGHDAFGIECTQ